MKNITAWSSKPKTERNSIASRDVSGTWVSGNGWKLYVDGMFSCFVATEASGSRLCTAEPKAPNWRTGFVIVLSISDSQVPTDQILWTVEMLRGKKTPSEDGWREYYMYSCRHKGGKEKGNLVREGRGEGQKLWSPVDYCNFKSGMRQWSRPHAIVLQPNGLTSRWNSAAAWRLHELGITKRGTRVG